MGSVHAVWVGSTGPVSDCYVALFVTICTYPWTTITLIMGYSRRIMFCDIGLKLPWIGWRNILETSEEWCGYYKPDKSLIEHIWEVVKRSIHTQSYNYKYQGTVDSYWDGLTQHLYSGLLTTCRINVISSCCILPGQRGSCMLRSTYLLTVFKFFNFSLSFFPYQIW